MIVKLDKTSTPENGRTNELLVAGPLTLYSTYLGGTGDDEGQAIAVDAGSQAFMAGFTYSTDFPLVDPFQPQKGAEGCSAPPCTDAFVLAINPSGGALLYSSYLGGSQDDYAYDLALDNQGEAYLTGETYSTDFPTTPGAYDVTLEGARRDAFVVKVSQPSTQEQQTRVIHYSYDPLGRLTAADYDDGTYFHYAYDAVGNRLSETTPLGTTSYNYDIANRLTSVNGVSYTWDDNGNLLNDGTNTYSYDHANRLVAVSGPSSAVYSYNGLGDRLQQTVNSVTTSYLLDLASGLTQVLADGTNTYLYGRGRIGEQQPGEFVVHLGDALGSVRQLVDSSGTASLAHSYEPYGEMLSIAGSGATSYGFTGEWTDSNGLINLRARYYAPWQGRFISRDTWVGDSLRPLSYNRWVYGYANPLMYWDPSGYYPCSNCNYVPYGWPRKMCLEFCCLESRLPWRREPEYSSATDSIPDWSTTDQGLREDRSEKVWNWICETGGWWGSKRCPDPHSLSVFLLWREGGVLYNTVTQNAIENAGGKASKGGEIMVRLMKFILEDGITKTDLSRFTAFFDPKSGGGFNMEDWEFLVSDKYNFYHNLFSGYVDAHWNKGPYIYKNRIVDRFWDSKESYPCNNCVDAHDVYVPPLGDNPAYWLYFGYVP